ncbi:MAG: hypothetical protein K6F51_11130 [Acetatifactor sp.]|nr:hypothetical protein [Acetatifactor sp.]
MSEKKTGQAERLFEAMSGVDPELLARSEKKKKVIPFQKYAKAMKLMAACLALIVVGGTCWATLRNGGRQTAAEFSANADSVRKDGVSKAGDNSNKGDFAEEAQATSETNTANHYVVSENEASKDEADAYPKEVAADSEAFYGDDGQSSTKNVESSTVTAEIPKDYLLKISESVDGRGVDSAFYGKVELKGKNLLPSRKETKSYATVIYSWLDGLELMPAEDQTFEDYVSVQLIDKDGNVAKEIRVCDRYLQKTGLEGTFEIVDENYDYDELRRAVDAAAQAEE